MTDTPRRRRIALIDRPWLGHRGVVYAGPLEMKPIDAIRAALAEFLLDRPTAALACRLDASSGHWVPVSPAEREAHLDCMLIPATDPTDIHAHLTEHLTEHADLPLVAVVSPGSLMIDVSHALGDAITYTRLMVGLAHADPAAIAASSVQTSTATVLQALARGARTHHGAWVEQLRRPARPPVVTPTGAAGRPRPAFAGAVLSNIALRDITRWRNAHLPGITLTSVLAAAAYTALTQHGIRVHDGGLYTLIDVRSQLPAGPAMRYGNLSKSIYLAGDLRDPRSIATALRAAVDSARAVPAIAVAAATSTLRRPVHATGHPEDAPVILTFNSLPGMPGMADLPWRDAGAKRFVGFGPSQGAGGLTVFAVRTRDHMELTASFDEATAPPEVVRDALEAVADPTTLLASLLTPAAASVSPPGRR